MKLNNKNLGLFYLLCGGFILRLLLLSVGTLQLDFNTYMGWSMNLVQNGFGSFYDSWSDYLPGYLYVLWLLGKIKIGLPGVPVALIYKMPAILADLATGFLIFKVLGSLKLKLSRGTRLVAVGAYIFNPAILANSTLWGQVDSLTAFFSMLAVYLVPINLVLSATMLAVGTIVKPQAALVSLVILFLTYKNKIGWKNLFVYGLVGTAVFVAGFLPFVGGGNIISFILERVGATTGQYPYTSVNAFSFWGVFGMWKPDNVGVITAQMIGYVVPLATTLLMVRRLLIKKEVRPYYLMSVVFLVFFMFMTRMHERHMLPVLAPLAVVSAGVPQLWLIYAGLSVTYVLNLQYAFVWITENFRAILSPVGVSVVSGVNILFLVGLLFIDKWKDILRGVRIKLPKSKKISPELKIDKKLAKKLLLGILAFSLVSRMISLGLPKNEYFDEVYHAFTARRMLHGDEKAWEWWNEHPPGFAYEWTHPPVAKLGMVLGMTLLGENSFGWRMPGVLLGVGVVYLVYAIGKEMFDETVGILGAGAFALDGLPLVISRIGMNDMYFLFFALASFYFYWRERNFLSAVAFGLAAASKWSVAWLVPALGAVFLVRGGKISKSLGWFFVLPPLIYIASYTQMFLTGHGWDTFVGVQKQMWWYHTGLVAEHAYTSAWWSWPFNLRPVYLFTGSEVGSMVGRIYAMGNPIIFWFGVVAAIYGLMVAVADRNKELAVVVFSYFVFFASWAGSPRIMFLYHYLPAIPFMTILIGYTLKKFPKIVTPFFALGLVVFVYFYPHWTGLQIPLWLDKSYYWFTSWR